MHSPHKLEQLTVNGYDMIAPHFDGTRRNFWRELSYISKYVRDGDTVLDLGSGNSRLYELIKNKDIHYIGVDGSQGLIDIARSRYPHLELHHSLSHQIPVNSSSVDVVVSLALIHHLTEVTLTRTLAEIHRVLKSGGVCIVTTWNISKSRKKDIWKQYISGLLGRSERLSFGEIIIPFSNLGNLRFVKNYNKRKLSTLFSAYGFELQSIHREERSLRSENLVVIAIKK
jgi:ubiquinone/menaquinone biosynthesis C-methylase UbiE